MLELDEEISMFFFFPFWESGCGLSFLLPLPFARLFQTAAVDVSDRSVDLCEACEETELGGASWRKKGGGAEGERGVARAVAVACNPTWRSLVFQPCAMV